MARRSRFRDLAGLAALGALGYTFFGPGRDRKDGTKAPVEDRSMMPMPEADAPQGARTRGLQETFMGLDDVSGPLADTGGEGRVNVRAADQGAMPPPASVAQAAAAPVSAASTPARPAASSNIAAAYRDPSRKKDVLSAPRVGTDSLQALTNQLIDLNRLINDSTTTPTQKAQFEVARGRIQQAMRDRAMAGGRAKGGAVKAKPKKMASGGMTSASKRADGIATKGKTKCKMY